MRKIFLLMVVMTVFTTIARDRLYIEDFNIAQGETISIPIQLNNDTVYCAFQTDLYLPEGLQVAMDYDEYIIDLTSRKGSNHVLSAILQPDGAIRIYVASQTARPFSGNSGPIVTIELIAVENVTNAVVALRNSILVEETGLKHYLEDSEALVNTSLVEGISLNKTETELFPNETETLVATITPDAAANTQLIWSSNNESVATVDQEGTVTAHSVGTAVITVATTDGSNLSASCTVTVKNMAVVGDVNGDGLVTTVDVTALYNLILFGDDSAIVNGDQDGDGNITTVDVTIVYQIILGI